MTHAIVYMPNMFYCCCATGIVLYLSNRHTSYFIYPY